MPAAAGSTKALIVMKTIRILFYTDLFALEKEDNEKCVSLLRKFIQLKLAGIAKVDIKVKVRTGLPVDPATKLTTKLLSDFDELWVFSFDLRDNPELMFDEGEVNDLLAWMKTGGVMVTGDHSQPNSNDRCSAVVSHEAFRALGFTLGSRLPRARQLRVWTGPPTACTDDDARPEDSDTYNTQVPGGCHSDLNELCLQHDEKPQCLEDMPSPPHFLFIYDYDEHGQPVPIKWFPDHAHVGFVVEAPDVFDDTWPPRPPLPQAVAKGLDKRNQRVYNLVVAYDGDQAKDDDNQGVGRIVSDASFHHYINLNLKGLPERDACNNPTPRTPLDQIAQYYGNLAYWLAPKKLREEILLDLFLRVATHLDVFETFGNGPQKLGRVAKQALMSLVGAAHLYRILEDGSGADGKSLDAQLLIYALTGRGAPEGFNVLGHEYFLGSIIEAYYVQLWEKGHNPLRLAEEAVPDEVIFGALGDALNIQASLAEELAPRLRKASEAFTIPKEPQGEKGEGGRN